MKLKAGVIGLGILGGQHATFLHSQPEVEVVAVADIRQEVADKVAGQVKAQAYTDYARMLKEHKLDVVAIATPDPLHRDPVLATIAAGVPNIILEKPLATTVADAEKMYDAAEQANARVFINYANRGSAPDRATYYVIQNGLLGEVVYGTAHLDDNITVPTQLWGTRTKEWVGGSSTAHFLLSHVTDYLHWVLAPAQVTEVFAISQRLVLGYTPDLYDAFLTFDNGCKFRVKAEWIKHIDGLVEFAFNFSGSEGSLFYIKRPSFGEVEGWRANVSDRLTSADLLAHQDILVQQGINLRALVHRPNPTAGALQAGGGATKRALEAFAPPLDFWRIPRCFMDAILQNTLTPTSWQGYGPLPTAIDGLKQTRVVCAIVESAEKNAVVEPRRVD
ncbi:MAG: Gfo/Idh/MocA family oxidoreductase [Chloroflexi bacterium]|nr:Gfo/Idh/MocA family oxidoreductase [Chloroflexota bacterium]